MKNIITCSGGNLLSTVLPRAPRVGLEPTTLSLTARCSAIELSGNVLASLRGRGDYRVKGGRLQVVYNQATKSR